MKRVFLAVSCFLGAIQGSRCNGDATPGPPNNNAISTRAPVFVKSVANGKLYQAGSGDDTVDVIHVWGTPYEMGVAQANLLGPKLDKFITEVYDYFEQQIIAKAANNTFLAWVAKVGISTALDLSFMNTKDYIQPYVMEEIAGMASVTKVSETDIRNVMWAGEITRGACSMFGAWGEATKSRDGKLLQLRALDWDVDGPFKNYPALVVYHPNEGNGHAWVNVGFTGWTASITGMSSASLGLSEIGVSYPDETFGKETYLAAGYPFGFMIRDILQFDKNLDDAINRLSNNKRTCDLILGVGDGNQNSFRGFQYSPNVLNVVDDENLIPVKDWHPPIKNVVYYGMDWICPNDNQMLADQLKKFHGNITAENTIRDIVSYVSTGDLHIAIYDHSAMLMYVAFAAKSGVAGPQNAYERTFLQVDVAALFKESPPSA